MSSREQFEKWASNDGAFPRAIEKRDGQYILLATQSQWETWQASRQALEIALPVLEQQGGWISCSERMPELGQLVLAHSSKINASEVAMYTQGAASGKYYFGASCGKLLATHWQPMPEGPSTTPQIDIDGWVEWAGGECPVEPWAVVAVKHRSDKCLSQNRPAYMHDWSNYPSNFDTDIIAYRVVQQERERGEEE